MKSCPNSKCKATGIPDEANFCPACGWQLRPGKFEVVNTQPDCPYLFGDNGKLMLDGTIKIDVRQITPPTQWYGTEHFKWDVVTGEHKVKAYVAKDEKLEFVFNKNGQILEINFYPKGKFTHENNPDAFESIMSVRFGLKRYKKQGWFSSDYYWKTEQFCAIYDQYGIDDMTADQWWKEHDIVCLTYLKRYKEIIKKHLDISDISDKYFWKSGEIAYSCDKYRDEI